MPAGFGSTGPSFVTGSEGFVRRASEIFAASGVGFAAKEFALVVRIRVATNVAGSNRAKRAVVIFVIPLCRSSGISIECFASLKRHYTKTALHDGAAHSKRRLVIVVVVAVRGNRVAANAAPVWRGVAGFLALLDGGILASRPRLTVVVLVAVKSTPAGFAARRVVTIRPADSSCRRRTRASCAVRSRRWRAIFRRVLAAVIRLVNRHTFAVNAHSAGRALNAISVDAVVATWAIFVSAAVRVLRRWRLWRTDGSTVCF